MFTLLALSSVAAALLVSPPEIELIGVASVAGDARDRSGLVEVLSEGSPHDRLGSFGSAIAWTGDGERYIAACDRGPADGAAEFRCRVQTLDIRVDPGQPVTVAVQLVGTTLLSGREGARLVGSIRPRDAADFRFDPEGLRLSRTGTLWISEEYGPSIEEFGSDGKWLRSLAIPAKFRPERLSGEPRDEYPPAMRSGRYPNKGFEGLAISPDGSRLMAIMQGPLIQDGGTGAGSQARHVRMLETDLRTGTQREFAYAMANARNGVCEILAIDAERFLVLERDGGAGIEKRHCAVYEVSTGGSTDISDRESLAGANLPDGVVAVAQRRFLDLMEPRFGIAGPEMAEKFEGLAFGPELPDGRRVLIVTVDNDMKADGPSLLYAFAVPRAALPTLTMQQFDREIRAETTSAAP